MNNKRSLQSVKDLFAKTWEEYLSRFELWRWFILIQLSFSIVQLLIGRISPSNPVLQAFLPFVYFFSFIISIQLAISLVHAVVEKLEFGDLLKKSRMQIGGYVVLMMAILAIQIGGMFLFVVPGIFLGIALTFATPIYLLEKPAIFEAIWNSWYRIKGYWWDLFLRILLVSLPNVLLLIATFSLANGPYVNQFTVFQIVFSSFYFVFETIYSVHIYQELSSGKQLMTDFKDISWYRVLVRVCLIVGILILVMLVLLLIGAGSLSN